ncbi:hypothetical protein, variant [Sphaeroforma arctica JP610]|uniref:Leucyl/phenylalanyl-tRNA--protein transferase n=1 Tax=Sphaeroforma arctica JP610 TaxID=667725 RepID=A0A0L0GDR5_9EUKA|nr:hypothetical protein, variant [Sphaeroforma arctica JP610]KNC87152.1 hypothetical protein, variant [Sphaeroforma arctica JP610]|eukprot:XP_014161055.1 hypothetical protein, variant [Sphaeroforma arctica JP610]
MLLKHMRSACNQIASPWDSGEGSGKCRRTHVSGHGYLYEVDEKSNLDTARTLMCADSYRYEFCYTRSFDTRLISNLMYLGFIPLSQLSTTDHTYGMIPKLHKHRCVLHLPDLKIDKSARKRMKHFQISINKCFDQVIDECVRVNGDGWLTKPLVKALKLLHRTPQCSAIRLCSFEIYNNGQLVGGEVGFTAGTAYTSLSGYFTMSSAGTVQMIATCKILQSAGFAFWDLGMDLPYKRTMGGVTHPIQDFLAVFDTVRCLPTPPLPSSVLDVRDTVTSSGAQERVYKQRQNCTHIRTAQCEKTLSHSVPNVSNSWANRKCRTVNSTELSVPNIIKLPHAA